MRTRRPSGSQLPRRSERRARGPELLPQVIGGSEAGSGNCAAKCARRSSSASGRGRASRRACAASRGAPAAAARARARSGSTRRCCGRRVARARRSGSSWRPRRAVRWAPRRRSDAGAARSARPGRARGARGAGRAAAAAACASACRPGAPRSRARPPARASRRRARAPGRTAGRRCSARRVRPQACAQCAGRRGRVQRRAQTTPPAVGRGRRGSGPIDLRFVAGRDATQAPSVRASCANRAAAPAAGCPSGPLPRRSAREPAGWPGWSGRGWRPCPPRS